jgi:AraC-like DNA-binding protein
MVASALGFSRQHLYRLFAGDDQSLERLIWRSRLERVRADLDDRKLDGVSLSILASQRGFSSSAHFSRAFRARYGMTALAYRRMCRASKAAEFDRRR